MQPISTTSDRESKAPAASRNRHSDKQVRTLEPTVGAALLAAMPRLRAFAISLCRNGDHADDLVQDTLLRACANIMSFAPGTNMLAWLCTIMKNHFFSECRRRRKPFESIEDHADSVVSKPAQVAHAECNELWTALDKLEPRQREVLIMIGASGLSYDEAANMWMPDRHDQEPGESSPSGTRATPVDRGPGRFRRRSRHRRRCRRRRPRGDESVIEEWLTPAEVMACRLPLSSASQDPLSFE
jgi:RNA polymerase sigma-70 factor (ECF subfamily)